MSEAVASSESQANQSTLKTLPGDDVRQIMWRYADRYDLQMAVQSSRSVARGIVARLVAEGERGNHEWTPEKNKLLEAFDESGITTVAFDPQFGGYIEGPKNLALALVAFELAWVDGGAATCSLATNLALAPIHECGTPEQQEYYMSRCSPQNTALHGGKVWRGAFALTEPIPYIGVDTGVIGGRVRVADWKSGSEPMLQVEKRGRFITNMGFANFVTAAVSSDDAKIKGTCMVILEDTDKGTYDRGAATLKLVHQLSSTHDPIFNLTIPASRIIGGYTIKDGVIVPNFDHSEIIEAVFMRTRVAPALMTSAKLLSAVEPVIRYQRQRFQGGKAATPGTPRYELGLQQKEDSLLRLVDIWTAGEAGSSLGFAAARLLDEYDLVEKKKDEAFKASKVEGARAEMKALAAVLPQVLQYIDLTYGADTPESRAKLETLRQDPLVHFSFLDALANTLVPACKLWNTGYGSVMLREAISLMGGYGITEDCPGFLTYKWMDSQLEATYEGPEAVQRRHLSVTMTNPIFLAIMKRWIGQLRSIASTHPGSGACALGSAMQLWLMSIEHLEKAKDANGRPLFQGKRQGVTFPLADALCWLLSAREFIIDTLELEAKAPENATLAADAQGLSRFYFDLCHVHVARAAGEVGRLCSELVFGYNAHPSWESGRSCYTGEAVDAMETIVPGISLGARARGDVIEGGVHPTKAGPCVCMDGFDSFMRVRAKLDGCITGCRLAKERAAEALTQVMIPAALDYPK